MKRLKKYLFINGEQVEAQQYTTLISPYSEEVIVEIPSAVEEEVNQAIEAAYRAREIMRKMPAYQRSTINDS